MKSRWLSVAASAAFLAGAFGAERADATGAQFDPYQFEALIDVDSDDTTGCDVDAEDDNFAGPVKGIEYVAAVGVRRFPAYAEVYSTTLTRCVGGMFESVSEDNSVLWSVGLDNGTNGADVVEFSVPRGAIGNPAQMTLSFHATRFAFNDVLLTTNGQDGGDDIVFRLPAVAGVPVLSAGSIALCVLLLMAVAWRASRRRQPAVVIAAFAVFALSAAVAWAATIMLDGNVADWAGISPIATDVVNDSTIDDPGEDIAAAFVTADALNVYFRMDQVNLAPVVCGNGSVEAGEECENDDDCSHGESLGNGGGASVDLDCIGCECVVD